MATKTSKGIELLKLGKFNEALAIFYKMKQPFTKDERRIIEIASESINGHRHFYESLGIDVNAEIEKSFIILKNKYL